MLPAESFAENTTELVFPESTCTSLQLDNSLEPRTEIPEGKLLAFNAVAGEKVISNLPSSNGLKPVTTGAGS